MAATIFVYRESNRQSVRAALSRMAATLLSFLLCLAYLLILPFSPWGMAAVIGIGAIILTLLGRSEDFITTGITTAVVMVVAGISPQVVARLRGRGETVRAMVHHDDSRADALRAQGAEVVIGDLTNPVDVFAAMSGITRMFFNMSVSSALVCPCVPTFARVVTKRDNSG